MSAPPVRVLQMIRIMHRAGIETWLMHLLRRFDRREVAMDFLVQTPDPGAFDSEIRSLGARILPCPDPHRPWLYARNFLRLVRQYGPYDVAHSHNYFFSGFDLRLAALAGIPTRIAHIHPVRDLDARRPLRSLYRGLMMRWIRHYSDVVLAPSAATLEAFGRFGDLNGTPQKVVRNCVDLAVFRGPLDRASMRRRFGLPLDRPVLIYVARFEPHKNHDFLIPLAGELERAGLAVHFAVAGTDGSTRRAFAERAAARPNFHLFVDPAEVTTLLRCADLFLFPSEEEGFGVVAIEAAAAGLPVVARDLPALREALPPSHRPFVFARGDAAQAAENVQRILTDQALARLLAADAREWARKFSVDAVAPQLSGIYGAPFSASVRAEVAALP